MSNPGALVGKTFVDFDAVIVETGESVRLSDFVGIEIFKEGGRTPGGPVIIDFYTSW
jgi:hypothetical protein